MVLQGNVLPFNFRTTADTRVMEINTEASLQLVRDVTLVKGEMVGNYLGLYSHGSVGNNGKVRFARLTGPKHILSSRKNGCTWNPKGTITNNITDMTLCPVEYNGELCPDALWGACWETILGVGNQIRDINATPQGRQLVAEMMQLIYLSLGNSAYDLAWFGQNPAIATADAAGSYTVSEQEWADFKDQQEACQGWLTYDDYYRTVEGLINFNVQIHTADVDGAKYIGNPVDLFERLVSQSTGTFRIALKSGQKMNNQKAPILVTRGIWDAYKNYILQTWGKMDQTFYYFYNGEFCAKMGCMAGDQVPNVLYWEGHPVIAMDEWEMYDEMLGMVSHRAILTIPGNYGLGYDVPSLDQYGGLGLRMVQRLDPPFQGKIFNDTTLKIGTAILNTDFMTSGALILQS